MAHWSKLQYTWSTYWPWIESVVSLDWIVPLFPTYGWCISCIDLLFYSWVPLLTFSEQDHWSFCGGLSLSSSKVLVYATWLYIYVCLAVNFLAARLLCLVLLLMVIRLNCSILSVWLVVKYVCFDVRIRRIWSTISIIVLYFHNLSDKTLWTICFLGNVGQIADVVIAICSCPFLFQIAGYLLIWFALSIRLPGHLIRAIFILVKRNEPFDYRGLG